MLLQMGVPGQVLTRISLCTIHKPCLHSALAKDLQRVDSQAQTEVYFVSICEARPKYSR